MKSRVCSGPDVQSVLRSIESEIGTSFQPTLAIVFCSVAHDFAALAGTLSERRIAVVGATSSGEIANADTMEEGCVAMLMDMAPDAFAVELHPRRNGESVADLARNLGASATRRFANPTIVAFASGLQSDGEDVVRGVQAGAGRPVPLFGGMAGDDLRMTNSFVFDGSGVSNEGVLGLVLDGDRFQIEGLATSGWQPVGVDLSVTHSQGNVVYTIEGEPALDVYRKYLNFENSEIDTSAGIAMALGVQYPLSVKRPDGTSVIRAPLFFNPENNAMIFAGGVPEGAKVKFCIPPSLDIVERVLEEATDVHRALPEADALILVACVARRMALGPLAEDEVQGLYDIWGTPTLGFFSYGEIGGRRPELCDFHTETCTIIALREVQA
ncbi:MAG TPA: FIST N-terminal domain-containing protein [Rhodothermales bacterium]